MQILPQKKYFILAMEGGSLKDSCLGRRSKEEKARERGKALNRRHEHLLRRAADVALLGRAARLLFLLHLGLLFRLQFYLTGRRGITLGLW